MRYLIAGLGSIGRRHLRNLHALGEKDVVLLRSGKSTLPDEELAGIPAETDLEQALEKWQPDGVIVSNPTAYHLDVALPAARAGCNLLLEKPISHSMDHVVELRRAAADTDAGVLVGFQFRFHPGIHRIKDLFRKGNLGQPLSARVHWGEYLPSWHPWEDYTKSYSARKDLGGGVVLTLCHPFDTLRMLFGEVQSVTAELQSGHLPGLEVEDTAEMLLGFESGVLGSVHVDYVQRPSSHTMSFTCENGRVFWDNANGSVSWMEAGASEWQRWCPEEGFERNTLFLDEMRNFIDMVNGKAKPVCTLEDGEAALEIALAAHQSSRQGRRITLQ